MTRLAAWLLWPLLWLMIVAHGASAQPKCQQAVNGGCDIPAGTKPGDIYCMEKCPLKIGDVISPGVLTSSFSGVVTIPPQHYTIAGSSITSTTLTVTRTKDCKLVVLEDTAEKIVIGCRKELAK